MCAAVCINTEGSIVTTSAFNHLFHRLFQYHGNGVKRILGLVNSLVTVP